MSVRTHGGQFVGSGEGADLEAEPISERQNEAFQPTASQVGYKVYFVFHAIFRL